MKILDHGYVELVEAWGSEERIVEAARMSTGKGFLGWGIPHVEGCPRYPIRLSVDPCPSCGARSGDEKLLRYLYENKHATPFEMAGLVLEVKAPIFVFREWHRHRTQSYNELSARYTPLPDENYTPTPEQLVERAKAARKTTNKQAASAAAQSDEPDATWYHKAREWVTELEGLYQSAQAVYERGLALGVPKELARLPVPVARYSKMRASANLRNWLAFLTLRLSPYAQQEIREYAQAVEQIVKEKFPRTWALFDEGRSPF